MNEISACRVQSKTSEELSISPWKSVFQREFSAPISGLYRKRRPRKRRPKTEDPEHEDPELESKLNGIHSPTLQIRVRGFHTAILSTVHEKRKGRKESVSLLSAMLCNTAGRLAPVACSLAAAQALPKEAINVQKMKTELLSSPAHSAP